MEDVADHVADAVDVDDQRRKIGRETLHQPDAAPHQALSGFLKHFLDHAVQALEPHPHRLDHRAVALLRQHPLEPVGLGQHDLQILQARIFRGEPAAAAMRERPDRGQRGARLLGDATRRLAKRREPFLAPQLARELALSLLELSELLEPGALIEPEGNQIAQAPQELQRHGIDYRELARRQAPIVDREDSEGAPVRHEREHRQRVDPGRRLGREQHLVGGPLDHAQLRRGENARRQRFERAAHALALARDAMRDLEPRRALGGGEPQGAPA